MGDGAIVLVCRTEEPYPTAASVLARLVEREIVEPMPTDCVLAGLGHRPGARARDALDPSYLEQISHFFELRTNGMEIQLPQKIQLFFTSDGGEPWVSCPRCERRLADEAMWEALKPHNPFAESEPLATCVGCGEKRPVDEWTAHDAAFGNLAFSFWNWPPLRESFLQDVRAWSGTGIVLIHEHI